MPTKTVRQKKRSRHIRRRNKPGSPPGLIQIDPQAQPTIVKIISCSDQKFVEQQITDCREIAPILEAWPLTWIDVTGLRDADMIREIGQLLGIHPLALEDVVNVHQRAKVDRYDDHLYIAARMVDVHDVLKSEQLSLFLFKGIVLTFQEWPGDSWDPVRQRLRQSRGRIRCDGSDHLAYALLDAAIDSYYPAIDAISDQVDALEEAIIAGPAESHMHKVHQIRGQLLAMRRTIRPHRDMLNELIRDSHPLISAETRIFLRDCYDHVVQLIDFVDTYRELTSDLRDFYLSAVSNRMNEVMKLLTIISTIFMPLGFIAGVYGMNFDTTYRMNMPELRSPIGYPIVLAFMGSIFIGMLWYFHRRKWI